MKTIKITVEIPAGQNPADLTISAPAASLRKSSAPGAVGLGSIEADLDRAEEEERGKVAYEAFARIIDEAAGGNTASSWENRSELVRLAFIEAAAAAVAMENFGGINTHTGKTPAAATPPRRGNPSSPPRCNPGPLRECQMLDYGPAGNGKTTEYRIPLRTLGIEMEVTFRAYVPTSDDPGTGAARKTWRQPSEIEILDTIDALQKLVTPGQNAGQH